MKRVVISRYRSIESCDVRLEPLTFLVGLNGAGKSNFIDALRFCRDGLRAPLPQAFANRASNLQTLSHFDSSGSLGFGMRLELSSPFLSPPVHYSLRLGPQSPRGFEVVSEECVVGRVPDSARTGLPGNVDGVAFWGGGNVLWQISPGQPPNSSSRSPDRLYLPTASGIAQFREVYDALLNMEFYNPDPEVMKVNLDTAGPADVLEPDGANIASVFERIKMESPVTANRIVDYMRRIVPRLRDITAATAETYKLLKFEQESFSGLHTLLASSMSDGTLRALAILIALFQRSGNEPRPTVLAIEEPETGLHPAATGILFDALREGATLGQILVSSHSPDLLDSSGIPTESILAVDASTGVTEIAPLDEAGRSALHDRLYTAGELLRMDQLKPERRSRTRAEVALFDI